MLKSVDMAERAMQRSPQKKRKILHFSLDKFQIIAYIR